MPEHNDSAILGQVHVAPATICQPVSQLVTSGSNDMSSNWYLCLEESTLFGGHWPSVNQLQALYPRFFILVLWFRGQRLLWALLQFSSCGISKSTLQAHIKSDIVLVHFRALSLM